MILCRRNNKNKKERCLPTKKRRLNRVNAFAMEKEIVVLIHN